MQISITVSHHHLIKIMVIVMVVMEIRMMRVMVDMGW